MQVGGGEETWATLTLMRVSTPVCHRATVGQSAAGLEGSLRGKPLITVGDVMIVEHFVKWSTQGLKTMNDSSGLSHDHQYSYYYAFTPFTLGMLKSFFSWKSINVCLKSIFSRLTFPDATVRSLNIMGCCELWCSLSGGCWWIVRPTNRLDTQTEQTASVRL